MLSNSGMSATVNVDRSHQCCAGVEGSDDSKHNLCSIESIISVGTGIVDSMDYGQHTYWQV